jgi:hypothetical protein
MWDRVRQLSSEQFAAIWNAADSLSQAAERVKEAVGGAAPQWAVLARAGELRAEHVQLKPLSTEVPKAA